MIPERPSDLADLVVHLGKRLLSQWQLFSHLKTNLMTGN